LTAPSLPAATPISPSSSPGTSPIARRAAAAGVRPKVRKTPPPQPTTPPPPRSPAAWAAAESAATHLDALKKKTRRFAAALRESTLPSVIKEAASANLSTLVATTSFRTADGEFHGFEGVNDHSGCCHGSCTHVWNYETSTAHLFPT